VALVRKRTIPTERPPLVGEVLVPNLRVEGAAWSAQRIPTAVTNIYENHLTKQDTILRKSINAEEKLFVTLRFALLK
jgi:hypothetical protein